MKLLYNIPGCDVGGAGPCHRQNVVGDPVATCHHIRQVIRQTQLLMFLRLLSDIYGFGFGSCSLKLAFGRNFIGM